jgi:hypothetical protein
MRTTSRLTRWTTITVLAILTAGCGSAEQLGTDPTTGSSPETNRASDDSSVSVTLDSSSSRESAVTGSSSTDNTGSLSTSGGSGPQGSGSGGSGSGGSTTKTRTGGGGGGGGGPTTDTTLASQTITIHPIPGGWVYGEPRSVIATASSGLTVSLAATGACQFANAALGLLRATGVGSCTVTANQAGGPGFRAAPPATVTAQIAKASPRIEGFGNKEVEYPQASFTVPLSATATGGAAVQYRSLPDENGETTCTVTGNSLQVPRLFEGLPRNCVVEAFVQASAEYEAASAQATVIIHPTFVDITGTDGPHIGPTSATATVNLNRKWDIEHRSGCGETTAEPPSGSASYTITVFYSEPSGTQCWIDVNTAGPDQSMTNDFATFEINIPTTTTIPAP